MTKEQAADATAANYGFINLVDYFINGDVTIEFLYDAMELYGNSREHQATKPTEVKLRTEFNPN